MQPKIIITDQEARQGLKAGVDKLANVVKSTLGPGGSNVILDFGGFQGITKDGVSVASVIVLEDPIENIGAQIVKEAASKTAKEAGDGTTTATVLAQAIFDKGLKMITAGAKPLAVKRGIDKAVAAMVRVIKTHSVAVANVEDIQNIANISANGDPTITHLITEAINHVGKDGIVLVEDAKALESSTKLVEGMIFERGFMSSYFATNTDTVEAVLEHPIVLIYEGAIAKFKEIFDLLTLARQHAELGNHPILIIAEDYTKEFVDTVVVNHIKKQLPICLVQAPEFGDVRKEIMKDIAALTGAKVVSRELGLTLEKATVEVFGSADKIRVSQWKTTIINGHGKEERLARENILREQMKETNDHALEVLRKRLAAMSNGVAVIYVGGGSEVEIREKKDRIDDALHATRAAIEEGIVPGGGLTYVLASKGLAVPDLDGEDEVVGSQIVVESVQVPLMAIAENVGVSGAVVLAAVKRNHGFNARTKQYEDLMKAGVVDPTKVVRLALENGASVAGMLLTTNSVVAIKPKA